MSTPRHGPRPAPPQETRAEVARRRLAQLAASFEATHDDDPFDRLVGPTQDASLEVSARADPTGAPAAEGGAEDDGRVVVDVAGQVRRPGIVTLPAGSRVHEAIERAGGIKGALDQPTLNLARVLVDGEQILVGVDPPAAAVAGPGTGGTGGPGVAVNLNTATLEELDALPGVGPVTAQAILDWRTENGRFTSVDDLLDVAGIGEKTLEDLRDRVSV
ncbi:helix-hairpin-helix domain-containing protein [Aeromicrobium sp. REDSEA-S32_B7]|uniref:helix-hairpin-helix domain-containing protein n=1 Tax=Aeromicrobium sp. REDSEA-S32_B7 TaxID=1811526 RepID=UPI000B108110|nr:helix-hairpin-helix domain-containing protein [Aeromicrobium sp. REDSEA-S32_B7]